MHQPHNNGSSELRGRLAAAAKRATLPLREKSYDVCQEGAFFHAGLTPSGGVALAPSCTKGSWALQDDPFAAPDKRFSGRLTLLEEAC